MNAGKSTALLQVAHNYEERGHRVRIFTAQLDDRYGQGLVTSRLGRSARSSCSMPTPISWRCSGRCGHRLHPGGRGAVPEQAPGAGAARDGPPAQHPGHLLRAAHGFPGRALPGSATLLALADEMDEMKTICDCGRKATMNMRVDASNRKVTQGAQVEIGGNARYRSVCGRCFRQG
jgi:thymidine kinase